MFKSKVDTPLALALIALPLPLLVLLPSLQLNRGPGLLAPLLLLLPVLGLAAWMLATTRYEVTPEQLIARSGPFSWRVALSDITSVRPTRDPRSAPALSLDRLQVSYRGGRTLLVSPRDKTGFLAAIERHRLT